MISVISQIEYCNGMIGSLPEKWQGPLQSPQFKDVKGMFK